MSAALDCRARSLVLARRRRCRPTWSSPIRSPSRAHADQSAEGGFNKDNIGTQHIATESVAAATPRKASRRNTIVVIPSERSESRDPRPDGGVVVLLGVRGSLDFV